ncbi:DM13 domain-containing protein [Lewinella sp. LCG006]|uniref:DM13 domain-containing protein n=1 Tax=Lewinella sp. LCG006 TaxID=3231911 RepID=UPI003460C40F
MKKGIIPFLMVFMSFTLIFSSCGDEDPITIDSSQPNGALTIQRTGTFTAESNTPTTGTAELVTDSENTNFLRFGSDFTTELATGTVAVYFSTSATFTPDPGNGNPDLLLIGAVQSNGEQFFKLGQAIPSNFTHVILWCNTASIPFGNAPLQ